MNTTIKKVLVGIGVLFGAPIIVLYLFYEIALKPLTLAIYEELSDWAEGKFSVSTNRKEKEP
jgi:hypothetical protein